MGSNIAIAEDAKKRPILEIADELGLPVEVVEPNGRVEATSARVDLGGEIASFENG
jgi:formyltetrahydrofolate synthetase